MEELKDIRPLLEITNYDFFYYNVTAIICIIISYKIIYKIYKSRIRKTKKLSDKEIRYKSLLEINYHNTKLSVYVFNENANFFLTFENKDLYNEIVEKTMKYKYAKETKSINKEEINLMKEFIQNINKKDIL